MKKENKLLEVLNETIKACNPINYNTFNQIVLEKEPGDLQALEKKNTKLGIRDVTKKGSKREWGVSTLSLIATITDILCDKRLCFIIENGIIQKVEWYEEFIAK